MARQNWVRIPSRWIEEGGLRRFRWDGHGLGSDNIATLMTLAVIAHEADQSSGVASITYERLSIASGLSRAKISNGLDILEKRKVIERNLGGRSSYKLTEFEATGGWAKFPAKSMYSDQRIASFQNFHLRVHTELDALKLLFLFVARRGEDTNMAHIGFEKIEEYSGIPKARIKPATSLLAANSLIYVEHIPVRDEQYKVSNAYRIVGVESYKHMGTRGRADLMDDFD